MKHTAVVPNDTLRPTCRPGGIDDICKCRRRDFEPKVFSDARAIDGLQYQQFRVTRQFPRLRDIVTVRNYELCSRVFQDACNSRLWKSHIERHKESTGLQDR